MPKARWCQNWFALTAVVALGACSSGANDFDYRFSDEDRDEIADLAADVCYDTVSEHEKISELEARIVELEARLGQ
jgi:predicted transcriptional regulator